MRCSMHKKIGMSNHPTGTIFKTLQYLIKMSPLIFVSIVFISLLNSIFQALSIYTYQLLFDEIANVIGTKNSYDSIINYIFYVVIVEICIIVIQSGFTLLGNEYATKKLRGYILTKVHKKIEKIDVIHFEETVLFEEINKAINSIDNGIDATISSVVMITYYIPYFFIMFIYFLNISSSIALIILGTFIPIVISNFVSSKMTVNYEERIVSYRREIDNYKECVLNKETRVIGAFDFFYNKMKNVIGALIKENWKVQKKLFNIRFITRFIRAVGYIFTYMLLFLNLKNGLITIGVLGSVYIIIEKFNGIASELFNTIGNAQSNSRKALFLYRFLDMPERTGKTDRINKNTDIIISDVGFKYPHSDKDILKNINLTIHNGETLAIVGDNGAGKTTLSKLIMGLYVPTYGKIYIGGNDVSEFEYQSVTENTSAVFQNFQKYKLSIKDNITISDIEHDNLDVLNDSLNISDISICNNRFTSGMGTVLARDFGGIELSGGEWQRLSIARGIYRRHFLIVLDEPTSAIDPIEETNLYNMFREIGINKTMIIVTHRLGAARLADRIIVMDDGEIIETGTHDELIINGKIYKSLWEEQKKWYE